MKKDKYDIRDEIIRYYDNWGRAEDYKTQKPELCAECQKRLTKWEDVNSKLKQLAMAISKQKKMFTMPRLKREEKRIINKFREAMNNILDEGI